MTQKQIRNSLFLEAQARKAIAAYGEQEFLQEIRDRQIELQISEAFRIMVFELLAD